MTEPAMADPHRGLGQGIWLTTAMRVLVPTVGNRTILR
jgi:hypothetical protein